MENSLEGNRAFDDLAEAAVLAGPDGDSTHSPMPSWERVTMCLRETAKEPLDGNGWMTMKGRVVVEAVVGGMAQGSGVVDMTYSSSEGIVDTVSGFARAFDGTDTTVGGVGNAGHEARVGTSSDSLDKAEGDAGIAQEEDMAYQVDVVHYEVESLAAHAVALEDGRSSHLRKP